MPRSKRWVLASSAALLIALLALVAPDLYAQGRMVTTTGVVFVRGIIGSLPLTVNALVTTSTDGLLLQNTTASTVGVPVQIAPRLRLCGTAWKTDATTASQIDCWKIENLPSSAAGATTSTLLFGESINAGAYTTKFSVASTGTTSFVPHTVSNANGALLSLNNSNTDAGVTNGSYISFQTAGSNRWYLGMSAAGGTGNFDLYDNIDGYNALTVLKGSGIVQAIKGLAVGGANLVLRGTVPTVTGGGSTCGTSAPVIVGTDSAGKVTTGSVAPTVCVVTFSSAWTNAPACSGANETTGNLLRPTSTTTTLTLTGTMVAGDVLAYHCLGY